MPIPDFGCMFPSLVYFPARNSRESTVTQVIDAVVYESGSRARIAQRHSGFASHSIRGKLSSMLKSKNSRGGNNARKYVSENQGYNRSN